MGCVNRATILGRLGKDPELKYAPSGKAVCNFTVATTEKFKDQERTEWHRLTAFDKTAELVAKYLTKGSEAYFEGRIQTRSWEKDGRKQYTTEILVDRVVFVGGRREGGEVKAEKPYLPTAAAASSGSFGDDDGEPPF